MNDHERGFLTFLAEPTRRRMETLLGMGDKRRADVRAMLDHSVSLDPRFAQHLSGNDALLEPIASTLRQRGAADTCYVLAADRSLDGREMPLHEALESIVGSGNGAFVSCLAGRLGFYSYENAKSAYLLSR